MADVVPATRTALGWIRARFGLGGTTWPPPSIAKVWEEIERFQAFRTSDGDALRLLAGIRWQNRYLVSPVPRMVSRAKANLLFGESPELRAGADADEARLEYIAEQNGLDAELHRAAVITSSEGEIWGRICVRPDLLDVPIIEFVSRRRVIPFFSGRFLIGATFVTDYPVSYTEVFRLFETYDRGAIYNDLYRGTRTSLGYPVDLNSIGETAGMVPIVPTGLPEPLVAFIPNSIDTEPSRGYADYCGLEDRFLGINRATTIGDTNTELAGKKRALIDSQYTGRSGQLEGDEIFVRDGQEGSLGDKKPVEILEYDYDAAQIVAWLDHLIDTTLTFGGASPQLVGRALDGAAISGTALKFKMLHSLLEASGSGRYFDRGIARLLRFAAIIDSRPVSQIGFGRGWSKPDEKPTIVRQDGLPRDDLEAAQEVATLVGAEAISVEERVRFLHPDWTEQEIDDEIKAVRDDFAAAAVPAGPIPGGPGEIPPAPPREQIPA